MYISFSLLSKESKYQVFITVPENHSSFDSKSEWNTTEKTIKQSNVILWKTMEDSEINKMYCLQRSSLEFNFHCRSCTSLRGLHQEELETMAYRWTGIVQSGDTVWVLSNYYWLNNLQNHKHFIHNVNPFEVPFPYYAEV